MSRSSRRSRACRDAARIARSSRAFSAAPGTRVASRLTPPSLRESRITTSSNDAMARYLSALARSSPATRAPRFGIRPNVAGRSKWARIEALQALKTFLTRYAQARMAWLAGDRDIEFPPGTYLMAHRFGVRVAPAFN